MRATRVLTTAVVLLSGHPQSFADDRPAALIAMQQAREAIVTAVIDVSLLRSHRGQRDERDQWRLAGADYAIFGRRDFEQGGPLLSLYTDGRAFRHFERSIEADVRLHGPDSPRLHDPRCVGLSPGYPTRPLGEYACDPAFLRGENVLFEESVENGRHVVTCKREAGTTRFWIDPEKGWNPVRVAAYSADGAPGPESRSTLERYGDTWYPRLVEIYSPTYKAGANPFETIQVEAAQLNHPDHPTRLTPETIGIDAGIVIRTVDNQSLESGGPPLYWDGEQLISGEEFRARVSSGELRLGPKYLDLQEQLLLQQPGSGGRVDALRRMQWARDAGAGSPKTFSSVWENYTRRFIAKYSLDESQSKRAMDILKSCQEQAATYLNRQRQALSAHEREIDEAIALGSAPGAARLKELRANGAALMKPIDDIFNESLKPRLEKLPTRAQRNAASVPARGHGK
ncbi:hypothetical protein RAS1_12810 [Phycisphaerae bacterium RAS1]|nr:hypothetical protein RAS1_12810 [Phycisphaerae bacterium RAS1]